LKATPASLGYRMPAEWEKHEATWLSWPKDPNTFPSGILPKVEAAYVQMVERLATSETVKVMVDDERAEARVLAQLRSRENVEFHRIRTVDVWVRDYGPTYLSGPGLALVKWDFNAWGGKYVDLLPDDEAGDRLARSTGLETFRPGVVLEGGSIEVNGRGTVITTEQCLLNQNRGPGRNRRSMEEALRDNLGVKKVVWLNLGIEGDDTDGHVDDVARFVSPRTVLVASEPDPADPNHGPLLEDQKLIESSSNEEGRPFEVVLLPMPPRVFSADGRLPATHLNFYVGNGSVLVPGFGGHSDREAAGILQGLFPEREVVTIDCRALVHGLGTLHCVTQQAPSAP
jgi:agmatine deiminase